MCQFICLFGIIPRMSVSEINGEIYYHSEFFKERIVPIEVAHKETQAKEILQIN